MLLPKAERYRPALPLEVGQRVAIPGYAGEPHLGTVSRVNKESFRVTFDFEPSAERPERRYGELRERYTYPRSEWFRFRHPDEFTTITPDSEA